MSDQSEAAERFVPTCPKCGYDLSGTGGSRCPECGGVFDRSVVFDPEAAQAGPWNEWADWLMVFAVLLGLVGWGFDPSHATLYESIWAGAVWALAFAWVYFRRRAILGPAPHWTLWLILVALVAPNRPNLRPPASTIVECVSVAIGAASVIYAFARAPRWAGRGVLIAAAYFLWFFAGVYLVGALVGAVRSQLGLKGGSFGIFNIELPAGGINDAIVAGIAAIFLIVGFAAHHAARRLRSKGHSG